MPYLLLGISLLLAVVLLAHWFVNANPGNLVKILRFGGAAILAVIATFFLATGRFALALPIAAGCLMLLGKLPSRFGGLPGFGQMGGMWRNAGGRPSAGQTSEVATDWVRMTLDHDTGEMTGQVQKGEFSGRDLDDMSFEQLIALLAACQTADEKSAALIASYLERREGADWQERAAEVNPGPAGNAKMTTDEAYSILGLSPGASDDEIRDAHRSLMKKIHPDQGGSTYLASKINEAKDLLLSL